MSRSTRDREKSSTIRAYAPDRHRLRVWAAERDLSVPQLIRELVMLAEQHGWLAPKGGA